MLCPEVWQFPPPKSGSRVHVALSDDTIIREVNNNPFYHDIFIVFPDTKQTIPSVINEHFDDSPYYKLTDCSLSELIDTNFIEGFINKGSLSCLSIGTDSNTDDIVTITNQGDFILTLSAQSYHKLGIQGEKLKQRGGDTNFYINIKLSGETFKSQKKFYERVNSRLKTLDNFNLILRWEPHEENICPSSVAKYFSDRGIQVEACTPQLEIKRQQSSFIPELGAENIHSIVEWMGMIAIGGDLNPEDNFMSSYQYIADAEPGGFVTAYHISGLFTPQFITQLLDILRQNILKRDICRWIGLTIQNFTDVPMLRKIKQRKSCLPEDNVLTFIISEKNYIFESFRSY